MTPVHPFALNDGVNFRLNETCIDGYRFTLSPPNYDMGDSFARLGGGTFSVIEASQMLESLRARLQGKWFSLGGYTWEVVSSAVKATVETRFESTLVS